MWTVKAKSKDLRELIVCLVTVEGLSRRKAAERLTSRSGFTRARTG